MRVERLIGHREAYEDHAADFMDDLFGDVEQSLRLHRTRRLNPQERQEIEEPAETVVSLVKVDMDAVCMPIVAEIAPPWIAPLRDVTAPTTVIPEQISGFDKFFLGAALTSMLLGASVVLGHYALVQQSLIAGTTKSVEAPAPENPVFSSEVKAALSTAAAPQPQITVSPLIAASPTTAPPSQTIVQYVPLFSPPPAAPPAYNSPNSNSRTTANLPANPPQPPPPIAITPSAPVIDAPAPQISIPPVVTPTASSVPLVLATPPKTVIATKPSIPQVVEPEVTPLTGSKTGSTLSGLFMLEPNDRSYALVEANGSVQSIPIGGAVGGTGWKLKKVNQRAAVLERNGQTRSVSVGQKF